MVYESGDSALASVGRSTRHRSAPVAASSAEHVRRVVGLHAVEHLHHDQVADQERRRRVAPVEPELAVVGDDVAHPQLVAFEVEGLDHAGAGEDPHPLAIGDRRRRRHVLLAGGDVVAADLLLPQHGPGVAIDRPQPQIGAVAHVQEDVAVPDDRRRARARRHRQLPDHVLGVRPLDRQALLGARAGGLGSAPVRPVVGVGDGASGRDGGDDGGQPCDAADAIDGDLARVAHAMSLFVCRRVEPSVNGQPTTAPCAQAAAPPARSSCRPGTSSRAFWMSSESSSAIHCSSSRICAGSSWLKS